jgi:hypothetical protein
MNYNIKKYNKYDKIIIISLKENNYNSLINILQKLRVIKYSNIANKYIWNVENTCIIYNIQNLNKEKINNKIEISKIVILLNNLSKNNENNKIIIISKNNKNIYTIGSNIFLHSHIVKEILKYSKNQDILENYKDINLNIYSVVNELIRLELLKIIKQNKSFVENKDKIKDKINYFIQKEKHKDKRLESIKYLNKLCMINNYKKNSKRLYNIDSSNENIFEFKNEKSNLIYEIINDNQIMNIKV